MQNIRDKVSAQDRDNARMSRQSVTNPAEFEAGMDDDISDFFGSDSGGFGSDGLGDPLGDFNSGGMGGQGFGDQSFNGGQNNMWGQTGSFNQPQQQGESIEDKFFDLLKKFFVGFGAWGKNFIGSFKQFDAPQKMVYGRNLIYTSLVCLGAGVLLLFFLPNWGKNLLVGAGLSLAIGVPVFMFAYDKLKKSGELDRAFEQSQISSASNEVSSDSNEDDDIINFDVVTEDGYVDDDDEDEFGGLSFDDPIEMPTTPPPPPISQPKSCEDVLDSVDVDKGMVTRQYIFEKFTQIIPSCDPNFATVTEISESSEDFDAWDALIRQTAELLKPSGQQEDMPYLISAKDKLFYTYLEIHRVKWLKNVDQFTDELVKICRFDEEKGTEDKTIFGMGTAVGMKIFIKIMKGKTAMVSLKDAYSQAKDFVLDTKNYLPVIWGIDPEGQIITVDLKSIDSMCIAGMPRYGKSWCVQAILTQMMMFLKPSELKIYVFDPKEGTSDFKFMTMPHIRKFVTDDDEVLKGLHDIVNIEASRRSKIIGNAGCVNIWDYKKKCPNEDMPLIYVVIDEVITFAERMKDKCPEKAKEFQSLLLQFVSRLPNLGIRIFMIPHVIKDQILKKTITDLIPCRASVGGNPQHVESTIGIKEKDFPYKLSHVGDMALKLRGDPMFVHGIVLSDSNETNKEIFRFLTHFWLKIEPESFKGSVIDQYKDDESYEEVIKFLNLDISKFESSIKSDSKPKTVQYNFGSARKEEKTDSNISTIESMDIDLDNSDDDFRLWDD